MLIGTVVGNVWATKKDPTLSGLRFLVIRPYTTDGDASAETIVAVDPLGAGIGERVLVVFGRAARHCIGRSHDIGFQTAVSAIIDKLELEDGRVIGSTIEHDEPATRDVAGDWQQVNRDAEVKRDQQAKRDEQMKRDQQLKRDQQGMKP